MDGTIANANDDEQERRNRRRSHAADLLSGGGGGSGGEGAANGGPLHRMTAKELTEHYEDCIKMSAEGKISAKNAFALHLIDYLEGMVKESNFAGFQVASSSLDAGAKIYAGRVDAVHQEAYKVLGGLGRSNNAADKKKGNDSDDNDEADDGGAGDADDDDDGRQRRRNQQQRKRAKKAVIAGNVARIRLKPTSLRFDVDPLFQQQAAAYDDGGTGELRMNNARLLDNACEILLDSDATLCLCGDKGDAASRTSDPAVLERVTFPAPAMFSDAFDEDSIDTKDNDDQDGSIKDAAAADAQRQPTTLCLPYRGFSFLRPSGGSGADATIVGGGADQSAILAEFVARLPPANQDDDDNDNNDGGDFAEEAIGGYGEDDGAGTAMQIDIGSHREIVVQPTDAGASCMQSVSQAACESFHPNASRNLVEALRDLLGSDRMGLGAGSGMGQLRMGMWAGPSHWKRNCKLTVGTQATGSRAPTTAASAAMPPPSAMSAARRPTAKSKVAAATAAAGELLLADRGPSDGWRRALRQARTGHKLSDAVINRNMLATRELPSALPDADEAPTLQFQSQHKCTLLSLVADSRHSFYSATLDKENQEPHSDDNKPEQQQQEDSNGHDADDDADLSNFFAGPGNDDDPLLDDDGPTAAAAGDYIDPDVVGEAGGGQFTALDQPFADAFSQAFGGGALGSQQVPASQPLQQLQQPYKVNQLDIAYAKTAKRINISRLKRSMWQLLKTEGVAAAADTMDMSQESASVADATTPGSEEQPSQQPPQWFEGERSFAKLLQRLPPKVGATTAQDLSVSIVFSCLLYLANEKTLHLASTPDLADMCVTHGLPQHEIDLRLELNPQLKRQQQQQQQQQQQKRKKQRQSTIKELWGDDSVDEDL